MATKESRKEQTGTDGNRISVRFGKTCSFSVDRKNAENQFSARYAAGLKRPADDPAVQALAMYAQWFWEIKYLPDLLDASVAVATEAAVAHAVQQYGGKKIASGITLRPMTRKEVAEWRRDIIKAVTSRWSQILNFSRPGRSGGSKDSRKAPRQVKRRKTQKRLRDLIEAKAVNELRASGLPLTASEIARQVASYQVKTLAREFAPTLKATAAALEKLIARLPRRAAHRARK